jgi:c(7)-type cytochrome triheme protein
LNLAELSSTITQKQSILLLWSLITGCTGQNSPADFAMLTLALPWRPMRQASGPMTTKMDTIAVPAIMAKLRFPRAEMISRKKISRHVPVAIQKVDGLRKSTISENSLKDGRENGERLGNGVDWEGAEQQGKINPVDYIEGISIKRDKFVDPPDFELKSKVLGMPDIIFSHRKHTVWNGCEVCHPEIFVGIKKGMTKYSMVELYEGKYCGVCHNNVAFPLLDCQRCHTEKVQ